MDRLTAELKKVLDEIAADFGGGCSFSKAYVLARLIRDFRLISTVDIGVYRGRSFFPQAVAHRLFTGGIVFGVDPYSAAEAAQVNSHGLSEALENWRSSTDFDALYREVEGLRLRRDLQAHCELIRAASAVAVDEFTRRNVLFDLVHIDGNHDTRAVMRDIELYLPRLRSGGFTILDDVSWASVKPGYDLLTASMQLVHEQRDSKNDYAVFWNGRSRLFALWLRLKIHRMASRRAPR